MDDNDCMRCGSSELVKLGNSYYTCKGCTRVAGGGKAVRKIKIEPKQQTLSFAQIHKPAKIYPESPHNHPK